MNNAPLAWKNGKFLTASELNLSCNDAGFVSATTVTDYCRTYRQKLFRWTDHMIRFRKDCESLGIEIAFGDHELKVVAAELLADQIASLAEGQEISLLTFATPGPIGYLTGHETNGPPTLGMHAFPLPRQRYQRFFESGVHLRWAGVLPSDPLGIVPNAVKHRSRLHWHLAARNVRDHPGAVATLTDQFGRAADTAIGNVLVVVDDTVLRPPQGTVLEGISMKVTKELCHAIGLNFAEANLNYRDLPRTASEMMLTGSAFGFASVNAISGPGFDRAFTWPGHHYRRLAAAWSELVGVEISTQFID